MIQKQSGCSAVGSAWRQGAKTGSSLKKAGENKINLG